MPDLFELIKNQWKQIASIVLISLLAVGVIIFIKPKQYVSVATAISANPLASDKSKIFNENVQALYSTLGTPDELDIIIGIAKLDTAYWNISSEFELAKHYQVKETGDAAIRKAAVLLKKNSKVMKSEYGELKVKVWDTQQEWAPRLANALLNKLQLIYQNALSVGNVSVLNGLFIAKEKLQLRIDSLMGQNEKNQTLFNRMEEYDKLISEYQILIDSKPPSLIILEQAKSSDWPDRPKRLPILIATGVLSFLFSLLIALVIQRRKIFKE